MITKKTLESSRRVYKKEIREKTATNPRSVMTLVVGVLLCVLGGYLAYYFTTSEKFSIASCEVKGQQNVDQKAIDTFVRSVIGQNIFTADLGTLAEGISALGWVEEVEIQRLFPDRISIDIKERIGYAYLKQGERKILMDPHGYVIVPNEVVGFHAPVIDFSAIPVDRELLPGMQIGNDSFLLAIGFLKNIEDELLPYGYVTSVMEAVDENSYRIITKSARPDGGEEKNLAILVTRKKLKETPSYIGRIFQDFVEKQKTYPSVIDLRFEKQVVMKI